MRFLFLSLLLGLLCLPGGSTCYAAASWQPLRLFPKLIRSSFGRCQLRQTLGTGRALFMLEVSWLTGYA